MNITLKTPHYRIDDTVNRLAVQFHCEPAPAGAAPKVSARLTAPERATVFATWANAAECFARYCAGSTLEIVRCDA